MSLVVRRSQLELHYPQQRIVESLRLSERKVKTLLNVNTVRIANSIFDIEKLNRSGRQSQERSVHQSLPVGHLLDRARI